MGWAERTLVGELREAESADPSKAAECCEDPAADAVDFLGGQERLDPILAAAREDADFVGKHINQLVEHLSALGCTQAADVRDYFDWSNRALASLYWETAKPSPSPSELTRLA